MSSCVHNMQTADMYSIRVCVAQAQYAGGLCSVCIAYHNRTIKQGVFSVNC